MLNQVYKISNSDINSFNEQGWIKLNNVLDTQNIEHFREKISNTVMAENESLKPLEERDTYDQAFMQVSNIWKKNKYVERYTLSERFAGIAAKLLGVDKVRVYHDQALFKEPGGGLTPWHQDQYYWPLDTNKTITMWMPLVDLDEDMGILQFASKSQENNSLGHIAISDNSQRYFNSYVQEKGYSESKTQNIKAGDATFHTGWNLHYAPENKSNKMREIMTIIYYADGAKLIEPDNTHRKNDLELWFPNCKSGDLAASSLNPLLP